MMTKSEERNIIYRAASRCTKILGQCNIMEMDDKGRRTGEREKTWKGKCNGDGGPQEREKERERGKKLER